MMKVPKRNYGCLVLGLLFFGLGFLGMGSLMLYMGFIEPLYLAEGAMSWVRTPCEVVSSAMVEQSHTSLRGRGEHASASTSTVYRIDMTLKYRFEGKQYVSGRYSFRSTADGDDGWRRQVVARLPPGTQTHCYVNPLVPSQAVIDRSFDINYGALAMVITAIVIGLAGSGFTLFAVYRK